MRGRAAIRRARRESDRHRTDEPLRPDRANRGPISPWRTSSGPTSRRAAAIRFRPTRKQASETLHTYLRLAPELSGRSLRPEDRQRAAACGKAPSHSQGFRRDRYPAVRRLAGKCPGRKRALRCLPPSFLPSRSIRRNRPGCACRGPTFRPSSSRLPSKAASPTCRPISIGATPATTCRTTAICWPTWSAGRRATRFPLAVHGPGLVDCHLYRQHKRLILHLVNLTNAGTGARLSTNSFRSVPLQRQSPDHRGTPRQQDEVPCFPSGSLRLTSEERLGGLPGSIAS